MKLNLLRETLLKPLQLVIGVVERKQTMPILSNVLLTTNDNKLSITGTDLETDLIGYAKLDPQPDNTTGSYQITLPGRKLMDICRALPDNSPVELYRDDEKNEKIILRSGRSRFTLSTLPAEDFPNVKKQDGYLSFSLPQYQLYRLLKQTQFAMAQEDVRYYLNGLLLEVSAGMMRAVATDGHRLATSTLAITSEIAQGEEHQIILPRKGVMELLRLLTDNTESINITFGNNHLCVSTADFVFTSKLVEGRFPNYERVIPRNGDKQVIIDRDLLKQALNRTATLCNEKYKGIRIELCHNLLRLSTNNPEQEAAEEEIIIDYTQPDLDIGFNIHYLLDILNTIDTGMIKLIFSNAKGSVLIEPNENHDNSAYVVMPMLV